MTAAAYLIPVLLCALHTASGHEAGGPPWDLAEQAAIDVAVQKVLSHPEECGKVGGGTELIPLPVCGAPAGGLEQRECKLPHSLCRYTFDTDAFDCWKVPKACQRILGGKPAAKKRGKSKHARRVDEPDDGVDKSDESEEKPDDDVVDTQVVGTDMDVADMDLEALQEKASQEPGKDHHLFCCYWASTGECDSNKSFMRPVCQKSCGTLACTADNVDACEVTVNTEGCRYLPDGLPGGKEKGKGKGKAEGKQSELKARAVDSAPEEGKPRGASLRRIRLRFERVRKEQGAYRQADLDRLRAVLNERLLEGGGGRRAAVLSAGSSATQRRPGRTSAARVLQLRMRHFRDRLRWAQAH